jgi:FtsP/CotA-like multicopper oxidase with cupredoxin domain
MSNSPALDSGKTMRRILITTTRRLFLLCCVLTASSLLAESLPPIAINDNHKPSGVLRDGVLTIQLEIAKGAWHPEADDGIAVAVYAFGQAGRPLQNPGPLIRVPQGTEIHASLWNKLPVPIAVHGLGESGSDSVVRVAPGATEQVRFRVATPGLYFYWGASDTDDLKLRYGIDSELTGALVVDPPNHTADDDIFVIGMMSERPGPSARQTLATINGKSWPYTQRFRYNVGQQAHWRWINATNEPHALHLHGFYYRIDAINLGGQIREFRGDSRPLVVTQRIVQGDTFDMSWSPDRPGQWLFHCHMFQHMIPAVVPNVPGLSMSAAPSGSGNHLAMHDESHMGQLVLGITVPETVGASSSVAWRANRRLRLDISERAGAPQYALTLHDDARPENTGGEPGLIGPPIILTRAEPVEIEVVNRMKERTAIHWHGIELESYYDGVPGWSGVGNQITPPIEPGTSFVARMTPPRAGTFIYHTHWHDPSQLTNGIYGPLIVLPPGQKFDPASDLTFVFSIGDFGALHELALINGTPQSRTLRLQTGKKYRLRLINISTNNQGMQVSLRNTSGPVEWVNIAKDGIDLPSHSSKAQLTVTVGETYDVEFSTATPQDLLLDLLLPAQKIHTTQTLAFTAASSTGQ